jgi:sirohydrochlorin ferrochelatase
VRFVDEAVQAMQLPAGMPAESVFLEIVQGRLIQDGIDRLVARGVTDIIVIPLFISSGSTHIDEIRYALGLQKAPILETDLRPFRIAARVHWRRPLDDAPETARMVCDALGGLRDNPENKLLILVGHGSDAPGFHERWRDGMRSVAAQVKELAGFAEADTAMLLPDQLGCKLRAWQRKRPDLQVVIAPLFLSEGYFTKNVIPARAAGFQYLYNGRALLPNPLLSVWLTRQITPSMLPE